MTVLDKIFKELEDEAIPHEWYAYEIKRTNQIIRANVEPLEQKIKELKDKNEKLESLFNAINYAIRKTEKALK